MDLLDKDSRDVQFVVIHGVDGIGKTTLAKIVFNHIASLFHGYSFLSDIRESSQQGKIEKLQSKLLSDILNSKPIDDLDKGISMIRRRCGHNKVLFVLDNLDKRDQLVKLSEKCDCFGPGSRDIDIFKITKNNASMQPKEYSFYEIEETRDSDAIQLISRHAFESDALACECNSITNEIMSITSRLLLALVIIGSSLYCKSKEVWDEVLAQLKKMPPNDVLVVLRVSYDMLEDEPKEIFLDIACHTADEHIRDAISMWGDCEFFPNLAITVLVNVFDKEHR